jgi:cardiolipin synthase (CMP-forming)
MSSAYRTRDVFTVSGWLTLSRVGFAIAFPFVVKAPGWALSLMAAAGLSDLLDGWYARRFHQSTVTGAMLDPIADKLFAISVIASLVAQQKLSIGWALLLCTREFGELPLSVWLAFGLRAHTWRVEQISSNLLGKATTALQFCALVAALLDKPIYTWWSAAAACMGACAVGSYWLKFLTTFRARPE